MKAAKKRKLVMVEWVDCHGPTRDTWRDIDEIKESTQPLIINSVGFLVEAKNGMKTVVPHLYDERKNSPNLEICGQGEFVIPNTAIRKITVLKYP